MRKMPLLQAKFQSTLPRRERPLAIHLLQLVQKNVSIHAPTKGATQEIWGRPWIRIWFQSTLPRRERPCPLVPALPILCFNPRSHEGSDFYRADHTWQAGSFNPRSHEGSDIVIDRHVSDISVSIHAPTKGATERF